MDTETEKMEIEMDKNQNESAGDYKFPIWMPFRRKFTPDGPFFAPGNAERELLAKQATLELTEDENAQIGVLQYEEFGDLPCPIIGCGARLSAMNDFEDHYLARHTSTCSVCSKVFPTTRLLNLHVAESHDSFFQAKVARGYPMYECLVEGCGMKFNTDRARHRHLVDKHKFPMSFEFHKRRHPSKRQRQRQRQRLRARHSSNTGETPLDKENMEVEKNIDALASAVSNLTTEDNTPTVVTFGRRHNRAFGFVPHSLHRKTS
uniref:C2H2-type domain-containing protein n=1 Tax=Picea sitchensis TaxID=3332 RepID=A9NZ35_PICSI|nr:unknown [Picea sitchensis]